MRKIYNNYADKNVATRVVYVSYDEGKVKHGDGHPWYFYAYSDAECTKKIDSETLLDMFLKGCVVHGVFPDPQGVSGKEYYAIPTKFTVDGPGRGYSYMSLDVGVTDAELVCGSELDLDNPTPDSGSSPK